MRMRPASEMELQESNIQFIAGMNAWCRNFPGGEVCELPGLIAAWCNTALPFSNAIFLSRPVEDRADLEERVGALADYLAGKRKAPLVAVCEEWIPEPLRSAAPEIIARAGLKPVMTLTGMVADELAAPVRPLPELTYERVSDEAARNQVSDVNSAAYGVSLEVGREAIAQAGIWTDDSFGYLGYLDGRAVAVAATTVVNGRLHVVCVASLPGMQRRGYGEAVVRHSLNCAAAATGLRRTTLHATEAGHPVYRRMGYRDAATFPVYSRPTPA